jgi:hypothetical protein
VPRNPWPAAVAAIAVAIGAAGASWAADGPPPSSGPSVRPYQRPPRPPTPHPTSEIGGTVTGADGEPVAHAVVRLLPEPETHTFSLGGAGPPPPPPKAVTLETDVAGAFVLKDLKSSAYTIRVSAKGFAPLTQAHMASGAKLELNLAHGEAVSGRVIDSATKAPVSGASVVARDPGCAPFGDEACGHAVTDSDGRFAVSDLPAGATVLEVHAGGYLPMPPARVDLPQPAPAPGTPARSLVLAVDPGAAVTVRLVDARKTPVRALDAVVAPLGSSDESPIDRATIVIDARGRITIRPLPPGTVTLRLVPASYADVVNENLELESGKTTDLGTIVVRPGTRVSGRVRDPRGNPVGGASVTASWDERGAHKSRRATTSADGTYSLTVPVGVAVDLIAARARGYAPAVRDGGVPSSGAVDLALSPAGRILGRAQVPGGTAAGTFRATAHLEAETSASEDATAALTETGHFALEDLAAGTYTVEIGTSGNRRVKRSGVRVEAGATTDLGTVTLDADGR